MRWGGDEFVLVLPGTRDERALAAVALRTRMDLHEAGVSASIGTAVQHVGELLQSAIDRADAAMYRDKQQRHQGRNRDHTISMSR